MSERCPNKNSAEWKQMVKLFGEKNAWKIFIKENEEVPDLNRIERYAKGYALKQQEELPEGTFNYTEGNRTAIELNKNLAPGFVVRLSKGSKNGKQFWEYEIGRKQPMKAVKLMQESVFNEDIEKLSNMIVNKLSHKSRPYRMRDYQKAIYDLGFENDSSLKNDISKKITLDVLGIESIENKSDEQIKKEIQANIKRTREWGKQIPGTFEEEVEALNKEKRALRDFISRKDLSLIDSYEQENQESLRKTFKSLFTDNKFKSERQGIIFLGNKRLQKIENELKEKRSMQNLSQMKNTAMLNKQLIAIDFINKIPNYKELISDKIENEFQRVKDYRDKVKKDNPQIDKAIKVRKYAGLSSMFQSEIEMSKSLTYNSKDYQKGRALFDNFDTTSPIIAESNSYEVVKKIASKPGPYQELANKILPYVKKNSVKITVDGVVQKVAGNYTAKIGEIRDKMTGEQLASFVSKEEIMIDGTSTRFKANPERLILHEIIHSITTLKIAHEEFEKQGKDIYNKILGYIQRQTGELKMRKGMFMQLSVPYGFTNSHEMIAEVLTNPDFQNLLKEIPAIEDKKYRNVLEQIVGFIADLFGIKQYTSVYDQLEELALGTAKIQTEQYTKDLESTLKEINKSLNEVDIKTNNVSFNQESSSSNKALESKLFDFLNANGINVKNIKELQGRIGVDALGMADLAKRAVYLSDHRKEDTLPEEVAHFVIEAMLDNRVVQNALALVDQTDKYKENYSKYMKKYNDVDMVKKEIVGKLLADAILDVNKEQNKTLWGRLKTMLKAIAKRFKSLYKPSDIDTILKQSLAPIARNVIENNISIETPLTQTRYYQLKEQSKEIDSTLKVLTEAVQSRLKKLVISKQYRKEDITEAKIQELERIEGLILNNKTTDALLGFVKIIYGDAKGTLDRLKQLNTENLNIQDQADILRRAAQLNSGYSPLLKKVKHELLMGRMEDKEGVSGIINQLSTFLDSIDQEYRDRSKEIFKAAIKDYITLNPEVKEDDIIPMLEVANRDLNFGRTWLDSMAESGDDILASTDRMVKDFFEKTQMQVQQISYDLIEAENNLKKAGEKDTSFMVEKYADGSNTGYFISDYHMGNYTKSRKDHALKVEELLGIEGEELKLLERGNVEIIEKYIKKAPEQIKKAYKEALGLNKGNKDKYFYEIFLEKFKKEKSKLWKPWFDENTKQNPKAKELIKEHADKLIEKLVTAKKGTDEYSRQMSYAKELHEEWIDKNTFEYKGEVTYVGDLSLPADKYKTPLPTGAKREYYDKVIELKKELDKHLPETRLGLLAPQIRKDWLERFRKNPKAAVTEALKDFERREDDIEYGLADTDGNPVNSVPIFYRRKLSNMSDLSTDITATMTRYADMAVNYRNMKSLVNVLEIGKDILAERKIKTGKKDALSRIFALFNNKDTYEEKLGGNAYDRYVNYINMVIYGKNKKDEGSFNVFGYNIDKAKAMDAFTRYTAINNLALNLYAGIANPIIGNWTIRQEAMAKEFFSNKDINYGAVQYTKDLPALMGSIGDLRTKSKLRLFLEKVNALDDLEARLTDVNTSRSKFGRLFNESTLFAGMHMGEHQMRGRAALALANTIKFTLNGKEINLYDAFEVIDNNKLELKKGVEFSEKDMINFRIKLKGINKKMHGIYNSIDKSALQQYSLGRAALLFRKFIKPGFNRRWNRREFNYELMTHTEGYYVTGGKFWINFIKEMRKYQFSFIKAYKELTPEQKMNVVRFNYEMLSLLGLMVLAAVAESGLDDDDDYLVTMIAYQINRLQSEMMFFWNPTELPKLLKSPAAGVDMLNTTIGLFTRSLDLGAMFTDDPFIREYKSGPNAGDTYFWHSLKKTVPVVDTIEDWFDPDEKLKYFNR